MVRKLGLIALFFLGFITVSAQEYPAYKLGEFLKYRISYGPVGAGFATLEVKRAPETLNQNYLLYGKGWTTGMTHLFFPVNDVYQSYIDPHTQLPQHFLRKINEGGYKKNKEIFFDYNTLEAEVVNHKHQTKKKYAINGSVQDMLSSVYYLRNLDFNQLHQGDSVSIDVFFDQEINQIKLYVMGRETIKSKFGKVKTLKVKPIVQKGRVFKDEEGVIFWVSDDKNKIPIKIKASILVGSIKAELHEYKQLANPFPLIFN